MIIYFDNAATTPPSEKAREAFLSSLDCYGNPSSLHSKGIEAAKILDTARTQVASSLGCDKSEIIFTGGGSESNNQAIFGLARTNSRRSKRIITGSGEHPSVESPLAQLEGEGFEIIRISVKGGSPDYDELERVCREGSVALVTFMLVNNESGAYYDIGRIRRIIDGTGCGAKFHCDAVQGFLKTPDRHEIKKYCDTASISAHKIGGIKGCGALFVKKGSNLKPYILGGGQEGGLRSGTENVPGIAAFGAACADFTPEKVAHISELYDTAVRLIGERLGSRAVFHVPERHVPTILSVSVLGVRSEVMLNALSSEGICVSASSACSSRRGASKVMESFGLSKQELDSSLRISFGQDNTLEECAVLAEKLAEIAKRIGR